MLQTVPDQRIVRGAAATLSWQPRDADGEPAAPTGTVTVTITRADGTVLVTGGATSGTGSSPRTYALTGAQTATLDELAVSWLDAGTEVATETVTIVGGVFLTTAEIRSYEPALANSAQPTAAQLIARRAEVETVFEASCRRAFVPRYAVERLAGNGTTCLPLYWPALRQVRFARIYTSPTSYTSLTSTELAAIGRNDAGLAVREDGNVWPSGTVVVIGYEHGWDRPPDDLKARTAKAVRMAFNAPTSGIPGRAISYQPVEGGNVVLATPGLGIWVTGDPEIDETLKRYRFNVPGIA